MNAKSALRALSDNRRTGGSPAGSKELTRTSPFNALVWIKQKTGVDLNELLVNFTKNYVSAQKKVTRYGTTRRKDMPVIEKQDMRTFRRYIQMNDPAAISKLKNIQVKSVKPTQKQIYLDKTILAMAREGIDSSTQYCFSGNYYVVSSDGFLIDGHHRWLTASVIDPSRTIPCIQVQMPIKKLLPLAVKFSDTTGNSRNA